MTVARTLIVAIFLVTSFPVSAQTPQDELDVIQIALQYHFENTMPYVESWVVSSHTEALAPGTEHSRFSQVREDYAKRNEAQLDISRLKLSATAAFDDLSQFATERGFDWQAFHGVHPRREIFTVRVARPGFSDENHAVVRLDIWAGFKNGPPLTSQLFLDRSERGWVVTGGESPAVRP